jgi:hypothetical protein
MRSRTAALAISLTLLSASSWAQPKPKTKGVEDRLTELSTRVDEAMRSAADSAAALKALQEVQRQITELRQELDKQKDMQRGYQETRRALEHMETRLGNAELQVATLRLEMAGRGQLAGYRDGFYLQTPNRRFELRINGLLQAGYEGMIFGSGNYPSDGQLGVDASTFLLRRAAVAFSGHIYMPELAYYLELQYGKGEPGPLLEGWGEIRLWKWLNLRGGKQKVPLGRQLLTHSSQLMFADRSGPTLEFAPGWDLGAVLHGEIPMPGHVYYQVGIFNGAGSNAVINDNIDLLYVARLTAEPLGPVHLAEGNREKEPFRFALGVSFAYNLAPTDLSLRKGITDATEAARLSDQDRDGHIDNVSVYTVGAELAARFACFFLQSELFYRREDAGNLGGDEKLFGSSWGTYAQLGYTVPVFRALEAALRYSYWEPNFYGQSRLVYRPGKVSELGAVINVYLWKRLLKAQLEYDHQWQRNLHAATAAFAGGANVHLVRLQLQAAF